MTVEAYRWREKCQKAEKKRQSEAEVRTACDCDAMDCTLVAARRSSIGKALSGLT